MSEWETCPHPVEQLRSLFAPINSQATARHQQDEPGKILSAEGLEQGRSREWFDEFTTNGRSDAVSVRP